MTLSSRWEEMCKGERMIKVFVMPKFVSSFKWLFLSPTLTPTHAIASRCHPVLKDTVDFFLRMKLKLQT